MKKKGGKTLIILLLRLTSYIFLASNSWQTNSYEFDKAMLPQFDFNLNLISKVMLRFLGMFLDMAHQIR